MREHIVPYCLATLALGVVAIAFRDLPLMPQRLPAGVAHAPVGLLCGTMLLIAGVAALTPRFSRVAMAALSGLLVGYVMLIPLPAALRSPLNAGAWLGVAEIGGIAAGAVALFGVTSGRATLARTAQIVFGLCALEFALCHFVYVDITASMVPDWLPHRTMWAYITGMGHAAAGVALVVGVRARLASFLEAAMCAGFVVMVHLPLVAGSPGSQREWSALATALAIAAAALAVGQIGDSVARRRRHKDPRRAYEAVG